MRLHAVLLLLHTNYIWGHAACYIAAVTNLLAQKLNIASTTIALGMCAIVIVCASTSIVNIFLHTVDQKYVSTLISVLNMFDKLKKLLKVNKKSPK